MKGKIFTAQEVQAIMRADKTQFREAIKPQPNSEINPIYLKECNSWQWATKESRRECPHKVGQKIFVKEIWGIGSRPDPWGGYQGIEYKADKAMIDKGDALPCYEIDIDEVPAGVCLDDFISSWQNARTMPQWASRIILQIKEIRVERLQEISEKDLKLEGFKTDYKIKSDGIYKKDAIKFFQEDWNSTHKKQEEKFRANPWVWVINFEVI